MAGETKRDARPPQPRQRFPPQAKTRFVSPHASSVPSCRQTPHPPRPRYNLSLPPAATQPRTTAGLHQRRGSRGLVTPSWPCPPLRLPPSRWPKRPARHPALPSGPSRAPRCPSPTRGRPAAPYPRKGRGRRGRLRAERERAPRGRWGGEGEGRGDGSSARLRARPWLGARPPLPPSPAARTGRSQRAPLRPGGVGHAPPGSREGARGAGEERARREPLEPLRGGGAAASAKAVSSRVVFPGGGHEVPTGGPRAVWGHPEDPAGCLLQRPCLGRATAIASPSGLRGSPWGRQVVPRREGCSHPTERRSHRHPSCTVPPLTTELAAAPPEAQVLPR